MLHTEGDAIAKLTHTNTLVQKHKCKLILYSFLAAVQLFEVIAFCIYSSQVLTLCR